MKSARTALFLALSGSAGCAVGPDYLPPRVRVPAQWSETGPGMAATALPNTALPDTARWWTSFNDPALDSLIARAIRANHDLRIAEGRVREGRAARGIAEAGAWPGLNARSSYSRIRRSENVFTVRPGTPSGFAGGGSVFGQPERNLFEAGFDASWEIDLFGSVRRSVEAAQADLEASEENRRDVLVTLLAEVARNYLELRGFQERLRIARDNIASQEATLELTRSRFQAGVTSDLDVARAEAQLATTRSQVPLLLRSEAETIHRLGVLLGEEPGALRGELSPPAPLPPAPPAVPIGLPSDLVRRRPDVRRAERELAAATARIGVAKADLFPRFFLLGSYGLQSEKLKELPLSSSQSWSLGPSLNWPIFAAGKIRSQVRVQTAREEEALARYEKAVLTSLEEVEDALVAHSRDEERRSLLAQSVGANRRAVELARELYRRGVADFLNVLEAERSLYASEDQLVQGDRALLADLVALYKAAGGGWEAFPEGE